MLKAALGINGLNLFMSHRLGAHALLDYLSKPFSQQRVQNLNVGRNEK